MDILELNVIENVGIVYKLIIVIMLMEVVWMDVYMDIKGIIVMKVCICYSFVDYKYINYIN